MDDDVWLDVVRLQNFLNEAEKDSREYLRDSISGYINSYYLEVARPGSDTNKVDYFEKSPAIHQLGIKYLESSPRVDVS